MTGVEAGWHLDKVKVHNSATNETVIFKCRAWLDATSGDGRIERMLYPLVDCSYKVELQTSDVPGAGTSANGVISLIGKLAEAGPIQLVNTGGSFQRGSLDVMTLDELPDIGPIQQVIVPAIAAPGGTNPSAGGLCLLFCFVCKWLRITGTSQHALSAAGQSKAVTGLVRWGLLTPPKLMCCLVGIAQTEVTLQLI